MLETIGVADHLAEPGCPIRRIAVADGLEPGGLHFDAEDDEPLGWMHENRHLRAALQARAEAGHESWLLWKSQRDRRRPRRAWRDRRARGRAQAPAPLLIAADGRNSADARSGRDPHRPLEIRPSGDRLGALATSAPHDHVAYEIFYPSGPFALLPMTDDAGGHRSAIVWSVPERGCDRVAGAER